MKNISKIAVVASACALAAALTACGSSSPAPSEGSGSAAPEAAATSAPVEEAAQADTSAAVEPAAEVGLEDAQSYANQNFGIALNIPEGWTFVDTSADQAQLDAMGSDVSVEAKAAANDGSGVFIITYEPLNETNADQDEATHAGSLFGESFANAEFKEASITLGDREIPASFASLETADGSVAALAISMKGDPAFLNIVITASTEEEVAAVAQNIVAL